MIIALPAHAESNRAHPPGFLGHHSFILYERGWRRHHWEGEGSLSIKTFSQGQALYDVGPGRYAVEGSSYLILNHGQRHAITIDAPRALESFCIFFAAGFAEEVFRSMTARTPRLLDEPEKPSAPPLHLTDLRLHKAKELLRHTECTITEVCAAVGFASLGSFSWLFRRRMNMAPETYRQQKR